MRRVAMDEGDAHPMAAILPIVLRDLVFHPARAPVINGLSARIATPGVTAFIGSNGAGKSVCLRLIDGLLPLTAGSISFGGVGAETGRRAFVFQQTALVRASVAANVALALRPQHLGAEAARARVEAALDRVGLGGRGREAAGHLSGGERQKLGLARALVTAPHLLLLDEPTASLDPQAAAEIERVIAATAAAGTKVLLVSHHLGQVARLAQDVVVLAKGVAVEHGATREVLGAPRHPATQAFLQGELPWKQGELP